MDYAQLHCHTKYSIQDGIPSCEEYVNEIYRINTTNTQHHCKGFAVTDHGVVYAFPKMYHACNTGDEKAIKPVYGIEVYMCDDVNLNPNKDRFHLILLASTQKGLENLYKIASFAGLHPMKPKQKVYPIVDMKYMSTHGEGIICLTACVGGVVPQCIINGNIPKAEAYVDAFCNMFDEVYLEVQPHEFSEQLLVNHELVEISKRKGLPLVMTSDSHYISNKDKVYQDILKQMSHQKEFNTYNHLYSVEEMMGYCLTHNIPTTCIANTAVIFDKCCDVDIKPTKSFFPVFKCPDGYEEDSYLRYLCISELQKKIIDKKIQDPERYKNQLLYELEVICSKGFAGYFLILWDWFKWCREQGILLGPGRGSAAGCMISYVLNITKVDPIKNGFIFERFMSPLRMEPPDIDTDIPRGRRAEAIEHLLEVYGKDNVCQIITFSEYKLKNTVKAIMSSLGVSMEEQNATTKPIPDLLDGHEVTYDFIQEVHNDNSKYNLSIQEVGKIEKAYSTLQEVFEKYPAVYQGVTKLKGTIAHTGIHAGGVIISRYPLAGNVALIDGGNTAVLPLVQAEMADMDFLQLLKYDMLGLKNLDIIKMTMDLTGLGYDWYDSEDYSDEKVYEMLRSGETCDVFQFSSAQPTHMIASFNCHNIGDLTAVNAGNRPGPLEKNPDTGKSMVDTYEDVVKTGEVPKIHPDIDNILAPTNGCLWYQEQCISLGQVMAGYDLGGADSRIRKTLGKKKVDKIPEIRNEFIYGKKSLFNEEHKVIGISDEPSEWCVGAVNKGYDVKLAEKIFDEMAAFAKYSFNKSHSGCYSVLAYKDAWLSYHYPAEFAVANCTINQDQDAIMNTLTHAKRRGIKVLPPDINRSGINFTIDNGSIRYGLAAIKGLGDSVHKFLKRYKELDKEPFVSVSDFYKRIHDTKNNPYLKQVMNELQEQSGKKVNNPIKKDVEIALIMSGAFDGIEWYEGNRYTMLNEYAALRKENILKVCDKDMKFPVDERKYKRKHKLAGELFYMGGYISEHPLDPFPYEDISAKNDREPVKTTVLIRSITTKHTKTGKDYLQIEFVTKDDIIRKGNAFDDELVRNIRATLKKNSIATLKGSVSKMYNNVTIFGLKPIGVKKQEVVETEELEIKEQPVPNNVAVVLPHNIKPVDGVNYANWSGT